MINKLFFIFTLLFITVTNAQVKIGDNPGTIDKSSILELQSTDKFIVITRMADAQMTAAVPLEGAMVYNTTKRCVFVYRQNSSNVLEWVSLCSSSAATADTFIKNTTQPTNPNKGDVWINGNVTSGWDGSNWVVVSKSIINGNGIPDASTAANPNIGDLYVDNASGDIYTYNGTAWVNKSKIKAKNGLELNASDEVVLGGDLTKPTIIKTDATNTLAIKGLPVVTTPTANDNILVIDSATGQLKQITMATSTLSEDVVDFIAMDLQVEFPTTIYTTNKINVFRNGVRVNFVIDKPNNKITLEPDAKCYAGDQIKIVQLY